ncbi:LPS-assembly protein LptD [Paracidobacterium acidisoli]|nr:LPS assembly protein LptD [Paracidobacterium acidisoli]MBT9331748.1 LPS assembly protein LptD [Paracidobacterium acidisoli]
MRVRLFLCITLLLLCHPQLWPQAVTRQFPPADQTQQTAGQTPASTPDASSNTLPDAPDLQSSLPEAHPVPSPLSGTPVKIIADSQTRTPTAKGNLYALDGNVVIYYRNYVVRADHATYNDDTGDVIASGHMLVDGGPDDEHFESTHGTINLQQDTGHFYDVAGTIGVQRAGHGKVIYTSPNPYALTGKEILQLGKKRYRVLHGTMTSCRLPDPDWSILAGDIELANDKATTKNALFQLLHIPLFYLPYVSRAVGENTRQSGILLPYFGKNTTRGWILGEGFYLTLGRSADITAAAQYYSKRGFAPNGMFRYKGLGENFGNIRFHSLLDRGCAPPSCSKLTNQGGIDVNVDGRYDLGPHARAVIDGEYLSSYLYRLVFEESYAVAINSEIKSQAFITHEHDDIWRSIRVNRYQNFQAASPAGDEVRILHLPELDVDTAERHLGKSWLLWDFTGSAAALSRYDYPNFRTTAEVPRTDFNPHLSLPLHFAGWSFRPEFGLRDTWYGKSQNDTPLTNFPTVRLEGINRMAIQTGFDLRPPALERDFSAPWLQKLTGGTVRHVLEPDIQYHYVTGINNFRQILRFDDTDIASNTNEIEYSLTQRFYLRQQHPHPCSEADVTGREDARPPSIPLASGPEEIEPVEVLPQSTCTGSPVDWLSWKVAQKYFFEPGFDRAITRGTPNPLLTTLDFSGIDFLTSSRHYSPVISRLHARTTAATDFEWDLDYDTKTGRLLSSNLYTTFHTGEYRFQFGDAYLNTPPGPPPGSLPQVTPSTTEKNAYHQIHLASSYGSETKLGFSTGINAAYDLVHEQLQYGAVQAAYNLDCCGLAIQWRKFSLGSIRDDTEYLYSFSFSGFASLGNLSRRLRLF